jgi:hypothetical protein
MSRALWRLPSAASSSVGFGVKEALAAKTLLMEVDLAKRDDPTCIITLLNVYVMVAQ